MGDQQESSISKEWKEIPEMSGYYTDCAGNLFSTRRSRQPRALSLSFHYGRGRKLYLRVKAGGKCHLAHRLIAGVHIGRCLQQNEVVNHLNGDTQDNRLSNLEVVSHHDNVRHAVQSGLYCSGDEWYKARGMLKG